MISTSHDTDFPKDTPSQVTGRRAAAFVEHALSEHCVISRLPQETDFGIDCIVTLKRSSYLSGRSFLCQIKGTNTRHRSEADFRVYLSKRTLNFYKTLTPLAAILLFVDLVNEVIYWEPIIFPRISIIDSGRFRISLSDSRIVYREKHVFIRGLADYISSCERSVLASGVDVGPFNEISEQYLQTLVDEERNREFARFNRQILNTMQQYLDNPSVEVIDNVFKHSQEVVMTSVRLQSSMLKTFLLGRDRFYICVDREVSMRGPGVWLNENWVGEFNKTCSKIHMVTGIPRRLKLVRFFVLSHHDEVGLLGMDLRAFLRILNSTISLGFINVLCTEDIFVDSRINVEIADLWMIPYRVMVLNTLPLYTAQYFTPNCEQRHILDYYSTFLLQLLSDAKSRAKPGLIYIHQQLSEKELRMAMREIVYMPSQKPVSEKRDE